MVLLIDIILIFSMSLPVVYLCKKFNISVIVGFLLTGILAGPFGLELISSGKEIDILAEVGVVLLLFIIGMEFSLRDLMRVKKAVLLGGSLQVFITLAAVFLISRYMGIPVNKSLLYGFLVSLSSTAIVLKILQETHEVDAPHGRTALAFLIFQDLIVVPMMLIVPMLSDSGNTVEGFSILLLLLKIIGVLAGIGLIGWKLVPWILHGITRTGSHELFLLTIVVICFSISLVTYKLGLSPALGAFLAGLVISETDYSHEAVGNITPFRGIFTSLFFISVGMLLDLSILTTYPLAVAGLAAGLILLKFVIIYHVVLLTGLPIRVGFLTGLSLCQIGEFSFILARIGHDAKLMDQTEYQVFMAVTVVSMILTPFIISSSYKVSHVLLKLPFPDFIRKDFDSGEISSTKPEDYKNHIIIVGYGVNGRNMATAATVQGIHHVIIEMNPDTVKNEKLSGKKIIFGDGANTTLLTHAGIMNAMVLVVVIPDSKSAIRVTSMARELNKDLYIIARTRFIHDAPSFYSKGANDVITEEFETSIQIFSRVLAKYDISQMVIEEMMSRCRIDGFKSFHTPGHIV